MQPSIQIFFVTLNPQTNNFEYQVNEFLAPAIDPFKTVEKLTTETHPQLNGRSMAMATTWHYEDPTKLLMTFLIYSDYFDFADANEAKLIPGKDGYWLELRPESFDEQSLLSHGLKHLSYHIIQEKPPKWMLTSTIEKLAKLQKELAAQMVEATQA